MVDPSVETQNHKSKHPSKSSAEDTVAQPPIPVKILAHSVTWIIDEKDQVSKLIISYQEDHTVR